MGEWPFVGHKHLFLEKRCLQQNNICYKHGIFAKGWLFYKLFQIFVCRPIRNLFCSTYEYDLLKQRSTQSTKITNDHTKINQPVLYFIDMGVSPEGAEALPPRWKAPPLSSTYDSDNGRYVKPNKTV